MENPTLSIITVTYNSEKFLEQTIRSVIGQTYDHIEYIIIDGNSTDHTLEIIKKYQGEITCWLSEPDTGIADAMNKGVRLAKGQYILFLNSDDYLVDNNILTKIFSGKNIAHSDAILLFDVHFHPTKKKRMKRARGFGPRLNFKMEFCHQGVLCPLKIFNKIKGFNTSFEIDMDYDFFLRAYRAGVKSEVFNFPLSVVRTTGISSQKDWPSLRKRFAEEQRVQLKNCPSSLMKNVYMVYWPFYLLYRYTKSLVF